MLKHHFVRPGRFGISGAIGRRRSDDVGGAARAVVSGRDRARGDEDGGGGIRHVFGEGVELVGEDLLEVVVEGGTGTANAE